MKLVKALDGHGVADTDLAGLREILGDNRTLGILCQSVQVLIPVMLGNTLRHSCRVAELVGVDGHHLHIFNGLSAV